MNHCGFQQSALAACEEMKNTTSVSISDRKEKDCVVCPKPRRLGVLHHSINDPMRSLRWQLSYQTELSDSNSKAGMELMELILSKGGNGTDQSSSIAPAASSPPFFCGSPPSRAENPLIQDARFGEEKVPPPLSPLSIHTSSPSSTRKGGCVRAKFGHKPAAVRVEGFDCLDRDRRNCSIPAVA